MRRGRGQVLYRFLPEQIVDYSDREVIGKVSKWHTRELTNIDMTRLISIVKGYASRFGQRIEGFPRDWSTTDFVVLEPSSIELDLFPLTFLCKGCGRAVSFNSLREFRNKTFANSYHCPKCKTGKLEQFDLVHYHTCGNLMSLVVRRCPSHEYDFVTLEKFGSNAIKRWMWQCHSPDHPRGSLDLGRVGAHCFNHDPSERMAHAPFRQGDVYYPESVTIVNVPSIGTKGPVDDHIWKLVLAEYLGYAPSGSAKSAASGGESIRGALSVGEAREKLRAQGLNQDLVETIIKELNLPVGTEELQKAVNQVDKTVDLAGQPLMQTASQVFEYQRLRALKSTISIDNVLGRAEEPISERVIGAPEVLHRFGFAEAYVTTDFPIVKAVFGYSRGDPERTRSSLRAFPRNEAFPQKTPIYGARIQTEAIILELDRKNVWNWLSENGWARGNEPGDDNKLKTWFLKNVLLSEVPVFQEVPPESPVTKWVYRLVHSLSHVLLSQASAIVGIDRNSIGEVLFPAIPALALYVSSSQEFQLGGMYTLFENAMSSWLDTAAERVKSCLHDPVCIETETACFACMFLAETSCQHFNRELGRDVLLGLRDRIPATGYWGIDDGA